MLKDDDEDCLICSMLEFSLNSKDCKKVR